MEAAIRWGPTLKDISGITSVKARPGARTRAYMGTKSRTSCPCACSSRGSAAETSASPPAFAKGATSEEMKRIFTVQSLAQRRKVGRASDRLRPMPIDVVFLEPSFPRNQREFVRALHAVGARVTGIGERPKEWLDPELRHWLTHYEQVGNITDEAQVERAVRFVQSQVRVDRLEAVVEAHVMCAARVREICGIPGTSVRTTFLCRDKPAMKDALRQAGIPCAQSIGSGSPDEIRAFAGRVGFPLVIKPRDAAGASGTARVDTPGELEQAMASFGVGRGRSVAVEEFIEGHEGFYDTVAIGGRIVHEFITHYYPTVLEAMRTRWISPQFVTTNRLDADGYIELKEMGRKVVTA